MSQPSTKSCSRAEPSRTDAGAEEQPGPAAPRARATANVDVTVDGDRAGALAQASRVSSTRFIEFDAAVWWNNAVRVMARNISTATFDLVAATLSVRVTKRRGP